METLMDQQTTGRTQAMTLGATPTRSTLAARSWSDVKRITDDSARGRARAAHFEQFPPVLGSGRRP